MSSKILGREAFCAMALCIVASEMNSSTTNGQSVRRTKGNENSFMAVNSASEDYLVGGFLRARAARGRRPFRARVLRSEMSRQSRQHVARAERRRWDVGLPIPSIHR